MAYLKINDVDYSTYVNQLTIATNHSYTAQTNAAGDTVVDHIGSKRTITVGIIPLSADSLVSLKAAIDGFEVSLAFRDPNTNALSENVTCIIPENEIQYYTIQADKVLYNAFELTFTEL